MVRWGSEKAFLEGTLTGDDRRIDIACYFDADGARKRTVNGKKWRRDDSQAGSLSCVVFTPDNLDLVKESPRVRREAVDELGTSLSASYGRLRSDYDKVLRHRNILLREDPQARQLASWTDRLISLGEQIYIHRKRLLARMQRHAEKLHAKLSPDEVLSMEYRPSWVKDGVIPVEGSIEQTMREHLGQVASQEAVRGTSLIGPHRDDISFLLSGRDARIFASQGQQRTIALAWKLAEVETVKELGSGDPLLLLDDVMSELDENRREALMRTMSEVTQTIITTATREYFEQGLLDHAHVIELS